MSRAILFCSAAALMLSGPRIAFATDDSGAGGPTTDSALTDLQTAVTAIESVADSAITLISSLAQQLRDLANSTDPSELPAELEAFAESLTDKSNALSAAVVANTPAAPSPISAADGFSGTVEAGASQVDPTQGGDATVVESTSSDSSEGMPAVDPTSSDAGSVATDSSAAATGAEPVTATGE